MNWKQKFMMFFTYFIQDAKINIITWNIKRRKDYHSLIEMIRSYLKVKSDRNLFLMKQGTPEDEWEMDWKIRNLRLDIYYLTVILKINIPESIQPMLDVLEKEPPDSLVAIELIHILSKKQEPRAVHFILKYLHNATIPWDIANYLWYCGEIARVNEGRYDYSSNIWDRYFQPERIRYYAYLNDEERKTQLQKLRPEVLSVIEPFLFHPDLYVKVQAYNSIKKIVKNESHPKLSEFEEANPDLDYDNIEDKYIPPSITIES